MKIKLDDIKASPKALAYPEETADLNARLARGGGDYVVEAPLDVDLEHYRAGLDVFLQGALHGRVLGRCARCLEEYEFPLEQPFGIVLTPRSAADTSAGELGPDDLALTTYDGQEIEVTPLVHEEAIVALPTRPLCHETCRGLCPRCGVNLNAESCGCPARVPDPRLAVLHDLLRDKP